MFENVDEPEVINPLDTKHWQRGGRQAVLGTTAPTES